jgi:hypothetical protein
VAAAVDIGDDGSRLIIGVESLKAGRLADVEGGFERTGSTIEEQQLSAVKLHHDLASTTEGLPLASTSATTGTPTACNIPSPTCHKTLPSDL